MIYEPLEDGFGMINTIEQFGRNAGRVWAALHSYGPLTESQLMEITSLRPHEIYVAVGWLARENKICKENDLFRLDETNLTIKIGSNAGKIWQLLAALEERIDTDEISRKLQIDDKDTYFALGWLAREGKIHLLRDEK